MQLRLRTDKDGNIHLIIEDDGKGFNLQRVLTQSKYMKNYGLKGMEEQATLLGGTFTLESKEGRGSKIQVKVPLRE